MKRPAVLLLALLLGSSQAATFKSKAYPYTLSVPDDWQSKKVAGVDVALAAPSSGGSVPASFNVTVTKSATSLKVTLADVRALALQQAGEAVKDLQMLSDADVKVSGLPGHLLNYVGSQQNVPMHWVQVFTIKNNLTYILTFAAPQANFDADKLIANAMLNSFKIN
ncbi:DUF1795 domain-containing protein [Deinococcus psychrotolerans]|uniref:DUF1795 domain-containing protein n=1 Tax=Deinococcus psychrotolerans TaxID=2489213 RepID=A0A3G8YGC0_9DEIO|nr:DcrB-related protein [Deinococcus psychrotolerans]AZI43237.1 DUF1795 domain-containing protein [Deinococcus psychrotolerans]